MSLNEIRRKVLNREGLFSLLYPPLWLLSKLYCGVSSLRNYLYDSGFLNSTSFGLPVVSVGNIVAGGSGKTPLVESLYLYLEEAGFSPTIVTRGYRGKEKGPAFAKPQPEVFGDEASVYALKGYRTVVSKDKLKGIEFAFEKGSNVVILDDGFQYRKVRPTLNLVSVDPFNPFGDEYCLPLGLLREPISSLERADAFVITRANLVSSERLESLELFLKTFKKPIFIAQQHFKFWVDGEFKRTHPPQGEFVDVFCGIGNPDQFLKMIVDMGYRVRNYLVFEDHHVYTDEDLKRLSELENPVTTEKDLIKLKGRLRRVRAPVLKLEAYGLKEFILANVKNVQRSKEEELEGDLAPSGVSSFKP
ncbi:MAG: tetraacyldisaccharide 4'-kinase [Desulfurobacteriaceae bacterium]